MPFISPLKYPPVYDVLYVGGQPSPGVAVISDADRAHKWDVKDGPGTEGAVITYRGKPPAKFTSKHKLWLEEHFAAWNAWRVLLAPEGAKKDVQPVDLLHPALIEQEIFSAVVETLGAIVHEGNGLYSYTIKWLEYRPPAKKNVTTTPSKPVANAPSPNAPPQLSPEAAAANARAEQLQSDIADMNKILAVPAEPLF
jgi:hypothetical protein